MLTIQMVDRNQCLRISMLTAEAKLLSGDSNKAATLSAIELW